MTSYEIFDLLCADMTKIFGSVNRIFTYKYVTGKQRIRKHIFKQNLVAILDFLNKL